MGKLSSLVWATVIALLYGCAVPAHGDGDRPKGAVFSPTSDTFDLGRVKWSEPVDTFFGFLNSGDLPLVFEVVHESGGNIAAETPKEVFPPGARGVIRVRFDGHGKNIIRQQLWVNYFRGSDVVRHTIYIKGQAEP